MGNPKIFMMSDNRPATYIQQLDQVIDMKPAIVMIVIPNNKGDHYAAVKKKCYLEKPIPSQCVTSTVLSKPKGLMSVASYQGRYSDELQDWWRTLGCENTTEGYHGDRLRHLPRQCTERKISWCLGREYEQYLHQVPQCGQPPHQPCSGKCCS